MDDETFKTELLTRLERIQSLLSYLCAAAKASEERVQARLAEEKRALAEQADHREDEENVGRALLRDEMLDEYQQAVEKWKTKTEPAPHS